MKSDYTTIYYQNKKTLKYERIDFQGAANEAEAKILAAVFRPRGYKLHKVVITTIFGRKDEKA